MKKSLLESISPLIQREIEYYARFLDLTVSVLDENCFRVAATGGFRSMLYQNCQNAYASVEQARKERRLVYVSSKQSPICRNCAHREACGSLSEMVLPFYIGNRLAGVLSFIVYKEDVFREMSSRSAHYEMCLQHLSQVILTLSEQALYKHLSENYEKLFLSLSHHVDMPVVLIENSRIRDMNDAASEFFVPGKGQRLMGTSARVYQSKGSSELLLKAGDESFSFSGHYENCPSDMPMKPRTETLVLNRTDIMNAPSYQSFADRITINYLVGQSKALTDFKKNALHLYNTSRFIMLEGERGLGKEIWSRAIHHSSLLSQQEFMVFDCTAFFDFIYAAEVFNEETGIFSNHDVTICLKEVSKLTAWIQRKIVDCAPKMTANNIRLVATTSESPESLLHENELSNRFYMLFYPSFVRVPPICEREEDIDAYLDTYIRQYEVLEKREVRLTNRARALLHSFRWPGNFKQLSQVAGLLVSSSETGIITEEDVLKVPDFQEEEKSLRLKANEEQLIRKALKKYSGVNGKEAAAEALGISKATLYRKIKEYAII